MITYKFRAECISDVRVLLHKIRSTRFYYSSINQLKLPGGEYIPDVEVELVADTTLGKLRDFMREVDDGHVMVQTVQLVENYTGSRNYDL